MSVLIGFTGSASALHALLLNAPPGLTMTLCTWRDAASGRLRKARRGAASRWPRVYCLWFSGWRQALKKQQLKNTLFWCCGFVITSLSEAAIASQRGGGGAGWGGRRYVIPHGAQKHGGRERWGRFWLPLFLLLPPPC